MFETLKINIKNAKRRNYIHILNVALSDTKGKMC